MQRLTHQGAPVNTTGANIADRLQLTQASIANALDELADSSYRVVVLFNDVTNAQLVLQAATAAGLIGQPTPVPRLRFAWLGFRSWLDAGLLVPSAYCDAACVTSFAPAAKV